MCLSQLLVPAVLGEPRQDHHKDFVLYRPTLIVDGAVVIDAGHLTALDDPEVEKLQQSTGTWTN